MIDIFYFGYVKTSNEIVDFDGNVYFVTTLFHMLHSVVRFMEASQFHSFDAPGQSTPKRHRLARAQKT